MYAQGDICDIVCHMFGPQMLPAIGLLALNVAEKELAGFLHP
jgi:hypothetical protein